MKRESTTNDSLPRQPHPDTKQTKTNVDDDDDDDENDQVITVTHITPHEACCLVVRMDRVGRR
jgi:hypothetical protein